MSRQVCDSRIKKEGWTNVKTLLQDATTYQPPNNKKYDIITLSYSLTMIPRDKWQAVIDNAYKMLRPGGLLGLADFTVVPSEQNITSRTFWKTLFAVDHVWLSEEHLPYIRSKFEEEVIYGHNKGGFPFIPSAVKCLYYYAIFRKSGGKANFATTLSSADLAKEALQQGEGGYFQRSPRLRAGKGRSKSPARHAGTGGISSN